MGSSKTITNYIVIFLAVLVLISGSVAALSEDFAAFGVEEQLDVCACDLKTDSITLQNTGGITSTFMLDMKGSAAEWANIAPQTLYLETGELKKIDRFIKVPCSARGEYTLNTSIRTLFDMEKVLEQTVNVQNCPNVQIVPKLSDSQTVCPCTPVQYNFEVINSGQHVEVYDISVEPYSDAISLSTDILILDPGQKEEVSVFINLECGVYGEQEYTFNAKAQGTGILGQTDFLIDIQKCYEFNISISDKYGVCQGVQNVIPFQVENKADIANKYTISLEGAGWTSVENITLDAWGGETVNSSILLIPPNEDETLYEVTLKAYAIRGQETVEKTIVLETEKCYDYELIETADVFKAVECSTKDHVFTLKNIGSRDATYYVDLEGFDWLTLSKDTYDVAAGETSTVTASGKTPCDVSGDFLESIYVTIDDINQTYLEDKTFTIYSKEEAYMPKIDMEDLKIEYDGGETDVKITNMGFETVTYDLSLVASNWLTLNASSITLAENETGIVALQAYPTNDTLEDVYAGDFVAKVSGEDVEYSTEFYVDLKENQGMPGWLLALIITGAVILLAIIIIILVLVFSKKGKKDKKTAVEDKKPKKKEFITIDKREYRRKKKEEDKKSAWPWILLVILLLVIGGAAYYALTQTEWFSAAGNETNETTPDTSGTSDETTQTQTTTPAPEETETGVLTNQEIQESLITIDRSAVPGSGNMLELENETTIILPMSIKNPTDRKAKFTVNTSEDSWVSFDNNIVSVMPNEVKTVNIKITPDMEALEDNDYSIRINTTLEGKKIYYEETIDLVLSKQKPGVYEYWPWLLAGLVALAIIIIISRIPSKKEGKVAPIKKTKATKEKPKKAAAEKPKKKEGTRWWIPVLITLLVIIILGAAAFWIYTAFSGDETAVNETQSAEQTTATEQTQTTTAAAIPEKITEDDVEESLITIDRSAVPGEGNVLELGVQNYTLPLSIKNPTDRKARFTVNTSNESWISFDQYMILVMPNSVKDVNMTLIPDQEALSKNDYKVTINTKLEGQKIDYEEELSFVLKKDRPFELNYWWYVLAGLIIIGLIILFVELSKRKGKEDKPKPVASGKKDKKPKKISKKNEKDLAAVNKDIAELRKKTVLKVKKGKY